jgi:hypothetical protein
LRNICPDGYGAVHLARSRKRGGGVAFIHRDYFLIESFPTTSFRLNTWSPVST